MVVLCFTVIDPVEANIFPCIFCVRPNDESVYNIITSTNNGVRETLSKNVKNNIANAKVIMLFRGISVQTQ